MHVMVEQPPYEIGDRAVLIQLEGDTVTVHSTRVEAIEREGESWLVTDDRAQVHEVDELGEGTYLVPVDEELDYELATKGEGFVAVEEGRISEPEITEPAIEQSLEHEIG